MQGLVVFSRLGVYMRLPGVDVDRFAESMQSGGLMGYFDALTGGSISKVGVFSLGPSSYLTSCTLTLDTSARPVARKPLPPG